MASTVPLTIGESCVYVRPYDVRLGQVVAEVRSPSKLHRVLDKFLSPGDTFLDVGANHGTYALYASHLVSANGYVEAFEANPELAECVRQTLGQSAKSPWHVSEGALGAEEGTAKFYFDQIGSGTGSLFPSFVGSRSRSVEVKLQRLDDLMRDRELPGRVLMKVDVEGAELSVLQGAGEFLRKYRPTILFEVNPSSAEVAGFTVEEILAYLRGVGYERFVDAILIDSNEASSAPKLDHQGDIVAIWQESA
ncbi:MAG: FkbM family methyltransferase [Planctomycetaceae bacterium]